MTRAQADAAFLTKWINERLAGMTVEGVPPPPTYRYIRAIQHMRGEDTCALLTLFLLSCGAGFPRLPPAHEP